MRFVLILLSTIFASFTWGQNQANEIKYPSLLWEVSGNGLEKSSYLYGTMHVSEKVAYHLSDAFFEKILETDAIALESNPEVWLDGMQELPDFYTSFNYEYSNSFYQSFATQPLNKQDLEAMFFLGEQFINGILYRKSDSRIDYEESTYLDMFLYQIGRRTKREVISLENFKESHNIVTQADMNNIDRQPSAWFKEKTQEKPYDILLTDAYRDKNLDLIDSLNNGMNTKAYINLMLVLRNENMINSLLDEFEKNKSVFAGVGAAHLPGEGGMIEMLRNKGYKVEPVHSDYTDAGRNTKESLEKKYISNKFTSQELPDGSLKINSPSRLYDMSIQGVGLFYGLDLPNSSFLSVVKAPRRDYLRNDTHRYNLETLDSLYFENIPGDIIDKKQININGFAGWDIKNKTTDGNRQHYMQILTPLELITVSYNGNDDFIAQHENQLFSSIALKELTKEWESIKPFQGGFTVEMPKFNTIHNNSEFTSIIGEPIIEAYDPSNQSNYFVIQKTQNDISLLEETKFEIERIAYKYLDNLKLDTLQSHFSKNTPPSFYTSAVLASGDTINLKSFANGNHYYLMGATGNKSQKQRFFDSFKFTDFNYHKKDIIHKDSSMLFTVKTNLEVSQAEYGYKQPKEIDNLFDQENKSRIFNSESKQDILVRYRKFHDYEYYENIDSLWNEILENRQDRNSFAIKDKKIYQSNGWNILEANYIDTANYQSVKTKYLQKGNRIYSLNTLQDRDNTSDSFVDEFYNSFKPKDISDTETIFEKKTARFFKDIQNEKDSIRKSAWKSISYIDFEKNDLSAVKAVFDDYAYPDEFNKHEFTLIGKIGEMESEEAYRFLEELYRQKRGMSDLQVAILLSLSEQESEESYKKILELMEYDLPLPSNVYALGRLFSNFSDNSKISKSIFQDLFQFYSVNEYKNYVAKFTRAVLDSTSVKNKEKRMLKKTLLTNAKLELKRVKSNIEQSKRTEYFDDSRININQLDEYISLMYHYKEDKDVVQFFNDLNLTDEEYIQLLLIDKKLENGLDLKQSEVDNIANSDDYLFKLYDILYAHNQTDVLKHINEEQIAQSRIMGIANIDLDKDSLRFDKKIDVISPTEEEKHKVFFYEIKKDNEYTEPTWELYFISFEIDSAGRLNPDKYRSGSNLAFFNDKDKKEIYKNSIDEVLHSKRKRAHFYRNYY